jgi:pimeloyl-ACP methyl ester carboxylesterase
VQNTIEKPAPVPLAAARSARRFWMKMAEQGIHPPGERIDIGGRSLHAIVSGQKTTQRPIVLEAGLTAMSACWAWVQEELSRHTNVLSYDRAGLGWSDPSGHPKDARHIAEDLHALIEATNFPRPFTFVGHSMGAIFGRAYFSLYPQDLTGMVFVDGAHPEQLERSRDIKWAFRRFFWFLKATPYMASCGLMKMAGDFGLSAHARELPSTQNLAAKQFYSSAQHMRATLRESEEWFTSTGQVRDQSLGDLPLLVITAPHHCLEGWLDLQKELTTISTNSRQESLEGSSHLSILTNNVHAAKLSQLILQV